MRHTCGILLAVSKVIDSSPSTFHLPDICEYSDPRGFTDLYDIFPGDEYWTSTELWVSFAWRKKHDCQATIFITHFKCLVNVAPAWGKAGPYVHLSRKKLVSNHTNSANTDNRRRKLVNSNCTLMLQSVRRFTHEIPSKTVLNSSMLWTCDSVLRRARRSGFEHQTYNWAPVVYSWEKTLLITTNQADESGKDCGEHGNQWQLVKIRSSPSRTIKRNIWLLFSFARMDNNLMKIKMGLRLGMGCWNSRSITCNIQGGINVWPWTEILWKPKA